jgi:hypothetical protein
VHLCVHIPPSCRTKQDPSENEALKNPVAALLDFLGLKHYPGSPCKTSDFTSPFSMAGRIALAWTSLKQVPFHSTCTERKGRRKDNYFTCQMPRLFYFIVSLHHSHSFAVYSVIYTTLVTWCYNLAANKLRAAQIIPKSMIR